MGNKHSHDRCTNRAALDRKHARRRATRAADEAEAHTRGITVEALHRERAAAAQQFTQSEPPKRHHVSTQREAWQVH